MASVTLSLRTTTMGRRPVLTNGRVFDSRLNTVAEFPITAGQPTSFELEPGEYTFQSQLPSGKAIQKTARIQEGQNLVELTLPSSAHKWLAWSTVAGHVPPLEKYVAGQRLVRGMHAVIWLRLWNFRGKRWETAPWPRDLSIVSDNKNWKYRLPVGGVVMLQIGGLEIPWRMMALPPEGEADVLIQPSESQAADVRGLVVQVASDDLQTESVLSYLNLGDVASMRVVGKELMDRAEAMLLEKVAHPMGAAVGGYFLLVQRQYDRLHTWPQNFANWIDWMPDSAVIHGWQLLTQPGQQNPRQALTRFIEATERGLPIYSVGLRYLYDGLRFFVDDESDIAKAEPRLQPAFARVAAYANAADWTKPYTTVYGFNPNEPHIASKTGFPGDFTNLHFLAEGNLEGLARDYAGRFPPGPDDTLLPARATVVVQPEESGWRLSVIAAGESYSTSLKTETEAMTKAGQVIAPTQPMQLIVLGHHGETVSYRRFDPSESIQPPAHAQIVDEGDSVVIGGVRLQKRRP
jgi:hypothetical protein